MFVSVVLVLLVIDGLAGVGLVFWVCRVLFGWFGLVVILCI